MASKPTLLNFTNPSDFATLLKSYLYEEGFNVRQLAQWSGRNESNLSRLLNNKSDMYLTTAVDLERLVTTFLDKAR